MNLKTCHSRTFTIEKLAFNRRGLNTKGVSHYVSKNGHLFIFIEIELWYHAMYWYFKDKKRDNISYSIDQYDAESRKNEY